MKINLSVIIPTLNNVKGLKYLLNYFKDKPYTVVVIDNKKKNLGFAGAVNKGAKDVKTKWMLILNDDIEFNEVYKVFKVHKVYKEKNKIEKIIEFAEENNLDAVSPILVNPNGEVENYGYKVLPYGKVELIKKNNTNDTNFYANAANYANRKIDGITAACLLIRTNVFKKLKGFDESFFAYLEDVDFFLRFKKAGYKMAISDNIKVLHNHMTTSKTMGNFKARQDMINWWRLYFKHKDRFKFNLKFIVERLKNVSGFLKAS